MKNIYDYINILGNKEETIKSSIKNVREKLKTINEEGNCYSYSNYIYNELLENHIVCKIINTKDYGYDYMHYFVLVPNTQNDYYLIDLTYSQFNNEYFSNLKRDGYIKINNSEFILYLSIVSGQANNISLDSVYFDKFTKKQL